jgi:peptidoglycan/xylan/chitin deacetylase (PgdA/CDA1 family)
MALTSIIKGLGIKILNLWTAKAYFSVLNYHRVIPEQGLESEHAVTPDLFEQQLIWLKRHFNVLPMPIAFQLAQSGLLPKNVVVITVDDGFYDSHQFIFPLLQKHQLTATFFITTNGIETGSLWEDQIMTAVLYANKDHKKISLLGRDFNLEGISDRRHALQTITELVKYQTLAARNEIIKQLQQQLGNPKHPVHDNMFITAEQIKHMHQHGMTIGAHTMHHPILALERNDVAWQEIHSSKLLLEKIISAPVEFFAYPNGKIGTDFSHEHVKMVEEAGFVAAFSTDWGVANLQKDGQFMLKRFTPWDKDPARFCVRLALSALSEQSGFSWLRDKVRKSNKL